MIAILDYDAGNLTSVELAVRHVGGDCEVTCDPAAVRAAERVIFPGVGSAESCMASLRRLGLDEALREALAAGKPVLAICIGLQLLFESSEEDDGVECLGVLKGRTRRFFFPDGGVKVPHMGWNAVEFGAAHALLRGVDSGAEFYFVHSYYVCPEAVAEIRCRTEYGGQTFCSAAGRDNLFATQFHPEKSGRPGLQLLRNFLDWNP